MNTYIENYLYSFDILDLDNNKLRDASLDSEILINSLKFEEGELPDRYKYMAKTTSLFQVYNIFTFSHPVFLELFFKLQKIAIPLVNPKRSYFIQAWLNVYRDKPIIDWHGHWPQGLGIWHGFYCVNGEGSSTLYKFDDDDSIVEVPSKPGRLVIGKSEGDKHKSTPWESKENEPRITIAFDIIPSDVIINGSPLEKIKTRNRIPFIYNKKELF